MEKYKWNLGVGCFCGLVVVLKNFHADLNGKETQILYNKSPPQFCGAGSTPL